VRRRRIHRHTLDSPGVTRRIPRVWYRRPIGWLWFAAWAVILNVAHRPWHELGGLLSERMRWLERFVIGAAFMIGCYVGSYARDAAQSSTGRTHFSLLRYIWTPPAALAAAAMLVFELRGDWPRILLVLAGFLAYWAGLDASLGAWPLVGGRHYSFRGPIECDSGDNGSSRESRARALSDLTGQSQHLPGRAGDGDLGQARGGDPPQIDARRDTASSQ